VSAPSPSARRSPHLLTLADAVLQPGFEGTTPPDWLRRRLGEGLGGVALFGRNIEDSAQAAELTAALRAEREDVIVAIDEEGGDVTRLEVHVGSSWPGNLALGAVDDPALTEDVARATGHALAAIGVTLDYAPSADVNSNPDNPVIGVRSFGADPDLVARHTAAWIRGLQSTGVAACAKHFPGHGDTSVDSHHDAPTVSASVEQLAATALPPFRAAIEAGVRAVMTGHLLVPAYDDTALATMSRRILHDLLRTELGFDGVVITDGIEMGAASARYGIDGACVRALAAGADAVCVGGEHADEATAVLLRNALVDAVVAGTLPEERLAEAASRTGRLAAWGRDAAALRAAPGGAADPGLDAARRALRVSGSVALAAAPHVVELAPVVNLAIGKETPWGVAGPLARLLPGTTAVRLTEERLAAAGVLAEAALKPAAGRPLVAVVRDAHRHPWLMAALAQLTDNRPDAIVVEMGMPGAALPGAAYIASHGAARVCAEAVAEVLAGTAPKSSGPRG
jgi:beta-N-acetylhexosaminidase